jgi:signal transduction histidine kinase
VQLTKKIKNIIGYIFAENENFSLENRLLLNAIIIGILTGSIGAILNLILSSSLTAAIIPMILVVLLGILYYFLRFKKIIEPFIIPITTIANIGISIIWVFNGGINGSNTLVAFVILILSLIAVPHKRKRYIISLFLVLNISIYLIQFYRPDLIVNFPSESDRWIDSVITLVYTSLFIYLVIKFLHKNYTLERIKVEESEKQLLLLNADKDRFISILAHDLKSPFNSILGFLDLLSSNIHNYDIVKIEKQVAIINNSAQNTYNLLEDLLMWVRSQSGKLPFEPRILNFFEIFNQVAEVLKLNLTLKKIDLNFKTSKETLVFADSDMIKTVLRNLISNAIKFTNPGGQINIVASQSEFFITISVVDNGIGIAKEIINKLFDVSQIQTTSGTANESGTGLGLSLCKEFIEKHGGEIWVESTKGKGSNFQFTLPVLR